jgi:adenosylcobinamide-phosphate synthase
VALALIPALAAQPVALGVALVLDVALGDPVYAAHPVRLIGRTLTAFERTLRAIGADGYMGGVALCIALSILWVGGVAALLVAGYAVAWWSGVILHVFIVYSLLAIGDLMAHGWRVERAIRRGNLIAARRELGQLVGRDTERLDAGECRRATVESLSENLTDGFTSPLFWYLLGGVPGLVLFKVVSTMDSMVGYKTPAYLRFGWCGARLDDAMNFVPARLTWVLVALAAVAVPGCSARKALQVGWRQHAMLPGPNSGWSEAAVAGAIQARLVGPIRVNGALVTNAWLGDPEDPPVESADCFSRAAAVMVVTAVLASLFAVASLAAGHTPGLPHWEHSQ